MLIFIHQQHKHLTNSHSQNNKHNILNHLNYNYKIILINQLAFMITLGPENPYYYYPLESTNNSLYQNQYYIIN